MRYDNRFFVFDKNTRVLNYSIDISLGIVTFNMMSKFSSLNIVLFPPLFYKIVVLIMVFYSPRNPIRHASCRFCCKCCLDCCCWRPCSVDNMSRCWSVGEFNCCDSSWSCCCLIVVCCCRSSLCSSCCRFRCRCCSGSGR